MEDNSKNKGIIIVEILGGHMNLKIKTFAQHL